MLSALPMRQRLSASDLVLPADSFSHSYVLCWTLASLFSHASLALNSVAGPGVDLGLASRSVSPTVIIASSDSLAKKHASELGGISSGIQRIAHVSQAQTMSAGRMPTDNLLFKLLAPSGNAAGGLPGKLRLVLASERAGTDSPALSSTALSDLRIVTRARICYALTAANVAGAVAQTNMYDYRRDERPGHSHFGAPLSSVEIKLVDKDDQNVDGSTPSGEVSLPHESTAVTTSCSITDILSRLWSPVPQWLAVKHDSVCVVDSERTARWLTHRASMALLTFMFNSRRRYSA